MLQSFGNLMGRQSSPKSGPMISETNHAPQPITRGPSNRGLTYTKIFRWRLPDGRTEGPQTVEVAGAFNHWQKVPLTSDSVLDAWHVTLHHIPGNRTHHHMLFMDGQPVLDNHCDGLGIPARAAGGTIRDPDGARAAGVHAVCTNQVTAAGELSLGYLGSSRHQTCGHDRSHFPFSTCQTAR